MSQRMLVDARHPEETRVAVIEGNRVEELDYESVAKRQLKGNIYLAKVTRVEPSLQACFVDYGGNRHGFLAFSEIHPDYYQIPVADREALIRAEAEQAAAEEARESKRKPRAKGSEGEDGADVEDSGDAEVEQVSGEEDFSEDRRRRQNVARRRYNIQEVIKRRQILLVQVVKEERGSKGAALTTYLSLAGRYCVLMPNSTNGGGISRKIANQADRKKLKSVMSALEVPEGMGCIIRTAGLNRTKAEIKRDFDYLERLWDEIRELTLKSVAPALIHEEASLIRRSIRDLYTREIDEVLVEGEEGYKVAKEFMRLLMPSHAKKVKQYKDRLPLFHRYRVEKEIEAMYSPTVQLKSGGYIVINPTEALVAIDVNSGRSTREHNIEETAYKTNLEAASEIARQLRLRDLAGLIVIDFIDMEDRGNNRAVEKRLKDSLKSDRARIQLGRLSSFGLLEMSRQRLRPNLHEASMVTCPHCKGAGTVRSTESAALAVLRALEEEGMRSRGSTIRVEVPGEVAFYLLNRKRGELNGIEAECGFSVTVEPKDDLDGEPYKLTVLERGEDAPAQAGIAPAERAMAALEEDEDGEDEDEDASGEAAPEPRRAAPRADEEGGRKRRRRGRRGRRGRGDEGETGRREAVPTEESGETEAASSEADAGKDRAVAGAEDDKPRRRSRRRRRKPSGEAVAAPLGTDEGVTTTPPPADEAEAAVEAAAVTAPEPEPQEMAEAAPADKPRRRVRRKKPAGDTPEEQAAAPADAPPPADKPRRRVRRKAPEGEAAPEAATPAAPEADAAPAEPPVRKGRRKTAAKASPQAPESLPETAPPPVAAPAPGPEVELVRATPEGAVAVAPEKSGGEKKGWWKRALGR